MLNLKIFIILSVVNLSLISCKNQDGVLITNEETLIKEYDKAEFNLFKNPMSIYWQFGLEPTCNYFKKTVRTICIKMYHKLKKDGKLKLSPLEENENYSYGCYPFRLTMVRKNKNGSDRIQRTNRCPFTLETGENLFLSHCFTISNSYFLYAAKNISKKVVVKVNKKHVEDARLVALVTVGKKFVWVWTNTPEI